MIKIPIEIGDTVLIGKFKNKRVVVKEFGIDEHGLPTINGRGILSIRIPKLDPTMKKEVTSKLTNLVKESSISENKNTDIINAANSIISKLKNDSSYIWDLQELGIGIFNTSGGLPGLSYQFMKSDENRFRNLLLTYLDKLYRADIELFNQVKENKTSKVPSLSQLFKEVVGDNEITVQASGGSRVYELFYRGSKDPASVGKILNKKNIDFKISNIEEDNGEYSCIFEIDIASLFAELFWEDGFRFKKLR